MGKDYVCRLLAQKVRTMRCQMWWVHAAARGRSHLACKKEVLEQSLKEKEVLEQSLWFSCNHVCNGWEVLMHE